MTSIQTLKNTLFWGNCWEHYQCFSKETTWNGKAIIHLSFAIVEAIPIIGQVISLAEMFFSCFSNISPTPPQIETTQPYTDQTAKNTQVNEHVPHTTTQKKKEKKQYVHYTVRNYHTWERDTFLMKDTATDNLAIHWACANGHFNEVSEMIFYGPVDQLFNTDNDFGNSPIHIVVGKGYIDRTSHKSKTITTSCYDLVDKMLRKVSENRSSELLNQQNQRGNTPLHLAYLRHDRRMIALLEKHGARADIQNNDKLTPKNMWKTYHENQEQFFFILDYTLRWSYSNDEREDWKKDRLNKAITRFKKDGYTGFARLNKEELNQKEL